MSAEKIGAGVARIANNIMKETIPTKSERERLRDQINALLDHTSLRMKRVAERIVNPADAQLGHSLADPSFVKQGLI